MVFSLICMQMTPKSMVFAVRLQRWSFRTSSLPASMICSQADALQSAPAEYCKDRGSLVYILSQSATRVANPIRVGSDQVMPVSVVRNLGTYMDADVSLRSHVSKTVAACFTILHQLRSIRRSVCAPFSSHWFRLSFCSDWTTVTQRWLAFHLISPSGCSRC